MTDLRLIATAAAGLALGIGIGYKVAEKRLGREFEERLEKETSLLRRMYKPDYQSPEEMVEALHGAGEVEAAEALKDYTSEGGSIMGTPVRTITEPVAYHKIVQTTAEKQAVEEKIITRSVFEPDPDRGEIYVISVDEYTENEPGYEQVTWNYYAKDRVVTDIHEDRIEDYEKYIGTDCL